MKLIKFLLTYNAKRTVKIAKNCIGWVRFK